MSDAQRSGHLWVAPAKTPSHWTPLAVWGRVAWRLWRHRQWTYVGTTDDTTHRYVEWGEETE